MKLSSGSRSLLTAVGICLLAGLFFFSPLASWAAPVPSQAVQVAWERAHELGAYHFTTQIEQTTYPAPALTNVGRSPRQETLHLEGSADLAARTMQLTLWTGEGSVANPGSGVEVRIEGEQGYGRQTGGQWQPLGDLSGAFAPTNDHLSYLVGAKNVRELGAETRTLPPARDAPGPDLGNRSLSFTRYAFEVNGPEFARHIRDQLERQLSESGELPLGLTLDVARQYRDMTGSGEVWIDSQGLPLRLVVHLVYPSQPNGEQVKADIQTDFSGFAPSTTASRVTDDPVAWATSALGLSGGARDGRRAGTGLGLLVAALTALLLAVRHRSSKKIYGIVVVAVILSMIVVPLLHAQQVQAFYERLETQQAQPAQQQQEYEAARDFQEQLLGSDWNPQRAPLVAEPVNTRSLSDVPSLNLPVGLNGATDDPEAKTDLDQDGLTEAQEKALGTSDADIDWDDDGLTDGQELLRLGTDPLDPDSDGDGLTDYVEVTGFVDAANRHWYSDPNNPDTNNDGQIDTVECHERVRICKDRDRPNDGIQANECVAVTAHPCSDTDGDGVPDLFDDDNDGDGVSDRVDLSPNSLVDRSGTRHDADNPSPFDRDHPFSLQVDGLTAGLPVFVDFQLRPTTDTHLSYAMNVLDWPGRDTEGQIQRVKDTTFATTDNLGALNTQDPRSGNGDLQLIPMLEIEMGGDSVPLSLTVPAIDVPVQGAISGTIHLEQQGAAIGLTPDLAPDGPYEIGIYEGSCASPGDQLRRITGVSNGAVTSISDPFSLLVDLADGLHAFSIADGSGAEVCADIGNVVNGPYDEWMIDPEPLQPYGISVRERDRAGTLLAYLPLNLVPDETGGGKAAFAARMVYRVGAENLWQDAQQVRVVWSLQMLTDGCDQAGFRPSKDAQGDTVKYHEELETYCAKPRNRTADRVQIVHAYDEQWVLTGLSVREDHGLDVAIAYEDPALDDDLQTDDSLWTLARGLGVSFLVGRDCDTTDASGRCTGGNGLRDLGVVKERTIKVGATEVVTTVADSTIAERFGLPPSASVTLTDRWGIPLDAPLDVQTVSYPHQDYVAHIAMTDTLQVLGQFPTDVAPTLLYAREEHYRSAGLDMDLMSWEQGMLVVDADPQRLQEDTLASLTWTPYRYDTDAGWEPYPVGEYWDRMEVQFRDLFQQLRPDDSENVTWGWMVLARSYYFSLLNGLVNRVQAGAESFWMPDPDGEDSDAALAQAIYSVGTGIGTKIYSVVSSVAKATYQHYGWHEFLVRIRGGDVDWERGFVTEWDVWDLKYEHTDFLDALGQSVKDFFVSDWVTLWKSGIKGKVGVGVGLVGAVAVVGLTVYGATQASGLDIAVQVLTGLGVIMAIQGTIGTVVAVMKAVEKAGSLSKALSDGLSNAGKSISQGFKSLAVVGLIIGIVVTWGAFALQVGLAHLSGAALITAIVSAAVSTVVTVLMFVIGMIPIVGWIISAVIGLIDAVVSLICSVFLTDEQQATWGAQWFCGGITGLVTKSLTKAIFSSSIMVDMQSSRGYPRLELYSFDQAVKDPEKGLSTGSKMIYSIGLTSTLYMNGDALYEAGFGDEYFWQWDDDTLKTSSFSYKWQTAEDDFHEGLDRDQMNDRWVSLETPYGGFWPPFLTEIVRSNALPLSEPGINRPQTLYLSEAYAVPKQVCVLGVCDIGTERGTEHYDLGQNLKLDVLPATLDGFYAGTPKDGGYSLAWGQEGDLTFPVQPDFDGDGLLYDADPDDRWWDTDFDGLSDSFELEIGSDPENKDSDDDGLDDHLEVAAGLSPVRPDTDGDGLLDGEEVFHQDVFDQDNDGDVEEWVGGWLYTYDLAADGGLLTTWVTPNPLAADGDGDSLSDFQEKTFGFHPRWPSDPSVMTFDSLVREKEGGEYVASDGFVKPGDTLYYQARLKNELLNRWAQGLLSTDFPAALDNENLVPEPFILYPQEEQVIEGDVPLSDVAATGAYSLTQVAGALIADWAELAGGAQLWYQFEEPSTATVFIDRSGHQPPHNGECSGSGCVPVKNDGVYGGALRLDGTSYVASTYDVSKGDYALSLWFKTTQPDGGLFSVNAPPLPAPGVQVYLDDGYVCSGVPYARGSNTWWSTICTPAAGYDDGNWHYVVHTYGQEEGQRLYVNGALAGSVVPPSAWSLPDQVGVNVGRSLHPNSTFTDWLNFDGLIDDVRVYGQILSEGQVQALFNQPVLYLKFDESSGWRDASAFGTDGSCSQPDCPGRKTGISGKAASFDGSEYVHFGPSPNLDLSSGRFTIGAWLYPQVYPRVERFVVSSSGYSGNWRTVADRRTNHVQGILGRRHGQDDAYPTLERVGRKIQFAFGAQNAGWPQAPYLSGDVLTLDAWNHVVLTFDRGTLTLYVNGAQVDQDSGTFRGQVPSSATSLTIGRTNNRATLTLERMDPKSPSQLPGGGQEDSSEYCWAFAGQQILRKEGIGWGPTAGFEIGLDVTVNDTGVLKFWEDDAHSGAVKCGPVPEGNDEDLILENVREPDYGDTDGWDGLTFSTDYASIDSAPWWYDDDGQGGWPEGSLTFSLDNPAVPFYGKIDEVVIYNRVLNDDAVEDLYRSRSELLRLPLDEPPGETSFQVTGIAGEKGTCSGAACPISGMTGRVGQAALFDGDDAIWLDHGSTNELTSDFTLAAWIQPQDLSGDQQILSTARTHSADGFAFGTYGEWLNLRVFGVGDCYYPVTDLQEGRWVHVAVSVQSDGQPIFYVNGHEDTQVVCEHRIQSDADDRLLIGATTAVGSSDLVQTFHGLLDDVRVYRPALSDAQIRTLFQAAPLLQLPLDEAPGATRFANVANYGKKGTCTADACPQTGTKGQLGLAAEFDGVDDTITVPDHGALDQNRFAVGAWVMPTALRDQDQPLVVKANGGGVECNYGLFVKENSMQVRYSVYEDDCSTAHVYDSEAPLVQNQWNHVLLTYDGQALTLYLNGHRDSTHALTGALCQNDHQLSIGKLWGFAPFAGRLDQITLYGQALSRAEVEELFLYQGRWVEDRQSHNIVVDGERPTSQMQLGGEYGPLADVQLYVEAHDDTSGVDRVQLAVNGQWSDAPPCQDAAGDSAWCPWFRPDSEGRYTLKTRAYDVAGNAQAKPYPEYTLYVDGTPPTVSTGLADGDLLNAEPHLRIQGAWLVHLEGTIADPLLPGDDAGSGVDLDSVEVRLLAADGTRLGPAPQWAAVAGDQWTVDYQLTAAHPDGPATLQVEAADQVGNRSSTDLLAVQIDASAPAASLDQASLPGERISSTLTFSGTLSEQPVPLRVAWRPKEGGGDQLGLVLRCDGLTLHSFDAGLLATEAMTYTWSTRVHRGVACQVDITAGNAQGTVEVCGSQVASWPMGSPGVPFAADATACGPVLEVAGVDEAQVAFTPILPGSAFYNQPPLAGLLLRLPFEDGVAETSQLRFLDISGRGHHGTCDGPSCPALGQIGHEGRAVRFDGMSDHVLIADSADLDLGTGPLSLALWFKSTKQQRGDLLGWKNDQGDEFSLQLTGDNEVQVYLEVDGSGGLIVPDGGTFSRDTWHHLAVVRDDSGQWTTYLDGLATGSGSSAADLDQIDPGTPLWIGASHDDAGDPRFGFRGWLDDLLLVDHALTPTEIHDLYLGAGPVLDLPFDEPWLTGGVTAYDRSGWAHDGTLSTGPYDRSNKAATGIVGAQALSFDGANDIVSVADDPGLDLDAFSLSIWVRPENTGLQPLVVKADETGGQRNYALYLGASKVRYSFHAGDCTTLHEAVSHAALTGDWTLVTLTYDGAHLRLYLNGSLDSSLDVVSTVCHNDEPLRMGGKMSGAALFAGRLDEARLYPRALSPAEVQALYLNAWQPAPVSPGSEGQPLAAWTAQVPAGLEGAYRLNLRGRDVAGHLDTSAETQNWWQGEVDTLTPRLSLARQDLGSANRFTASAQDFNLAEEGFDSPCGVGVVTERQDFSSAWYLALQGQQRLFQLETTCDVPYAQMQGEVGVSDTPGLAQDVALLGGYAYVADRNGGLRIVDISDPTHPQSAGATPIPYAWGVAVAPGGAISPPNLVVENLLVTPGAPILNQPFTVSLTVANQGAAPAWNFEADVYLDQAPTPCDQGAGRWQRASIAYLAAGDSITRTFVHSGFADTAAHDFYAQADSTCGVAESDEGDNIAGPVAVTPVAAELAVDSIAISPPSSEANAPFTVTVTISNVGTAAAQDFLTSVYVDAYAQQCDAGINDWDRRETSLLAPGASRTMTFTHPGLSAAGTHFVEAQVDSSCVVDEADELNNISEHLAFDVSPTTWPDLVPTLLTAWPLQPVVGQSFVVTVTVDNQGGREAGAFDTTVYADHAPASCGDSTGAWDTARTAGLGALASTTITFTHPGFTTTGWHTIYAFADSACEVGEEDEGNNASYALSVYVPPSSLPDLVVLDLATRPEMPQVGEPVDIGVTIQNKGTADATRVETCIYVDQTPSPCDEGYPDWYCTPGITLTAGASALVTYTLASGFGSAGQHAVPAQVDGACAIPESLEDNNISEPLTVTVLALTSSDEENGPGTPLTVTAGSPPGAAVAPVAPTAAYTYAYVADPSLGLRVFDVSDPASPTQVSTLAVGGSARDVAVQGDYAYLVSEFEGLKVIDISSPGFPGLVGAYGTLDKAEGVAVLGNYAYVADGLAGLHVVDVTDPAHPLGVGQLDLPGYAWDVAIAAGPGGRHAYVAAGVAGLQVVDVTDPAHPQLVGTADTAQVAMGVAVDDTNALVADGSGGLGVVNVADPAQPQFVRLIDTPGYAQAVQATGDLAYVADDSQGLRIINYDGIVPQATACDTFGHCATVEATLLAERSATARARPTQTPLVTVTIVSPPGLLDSTDPVSVTGEAASAFSYLKDLTLKADGTPIHNQSWANGAVNETIWSADWTPAGEGQYLLQAELTDWSDNVASTTATVTVDTTPPEIAIAPTVYTGTHYYEPRTVDISGLFTDTGGVSSVQVTVAGQSGAAYLNATDHTWRFPWQLDGGDLPDGATYAVTAQAVDIVGHTALAAEMVTVDVLPPSAVTLTLSTDGRELAPFATLTQTAPTLSLAWTASSDGSGVAGYQAGWTAQTTATVSQTLAAYGPADPRQATLVVGEGQKIIAQVASRDVFGNRRWQGFGPIYADSPQTPDYVLLDDPDGTYYGWLESGCTLLGVDRRIARRAPGGASLSAEQKLYATWNAEALRLAWTGANWSSDGDLFIYLDSQAGGTRSAYNPYSASPPNDVLLPEGLDADYLVWVQDEATALLLHWTGAEWVVEQGLEAGQYQFHASLHQGHTDLYLPFAWLDISTPASNSLKLVALASEDASTGAGEALRLWAAMPPTNSLNSDRVLAAGASSGEDLVLSHDYRWAALAAGLCPNGSDGPAVGAYLDVDLGVSVSAEPAGAAQSLPLVGDVDLSTLLGWSDTAHAPVGPGQEIVYRVRYQNRGEDPATGVSLDITASQALGLPDGDTAQHQVVALGQVGSGERGEITFRGVVSTSLSAEPGAAVEINLFDDAHGPGDAPLARLWVQHSVDNEPPAFFGIQQPAYAVPTGVNALLGYAYDEVGVSQMELEVQSPGAGTSYLTCPDALPGDGVWTCDWEVTGGNDDPLSVRLRASDGFGQASGWSEAQQFLIDVQPPEVTLDITASDVVSGSLFRGGVFGLYGDVTDNGGVALVDVCVEGNCSAADLQPDAALGTVDYEDLPASPLPLGSGAACGGSEVVRAFDVAEDFAIGEVSLGLVAEHSQRDDLWAELQSPAGTRVRLLNGDGWAGAAYRDYDLLLNDAGPTSVALALGDHDPTSPFYEHLARPVEPLRAFLGQPSAGTWTLRLCDLDPASHDGAYLRSRLTLTPRDTAAKSGAWSFQASTASGLDHVPQLVTIYGEDEVGNRTSDPLSLVVWVDNVPPVITVTEVISQVQLDQTETVLRGSVHEGGPLLQMDAHIETPGGEALRQQVARAGNDWWLDMEGNAPGRYVVWLRATDQAGNAATAGPFAVDVLCLAADLHVVSISAEPAPGSPTALLLSAVISNTGAALPAGLPVSFYADDAWIGTEITSQPLGVGQFQSVTMAWNVGAPGSYALSVVPNDGSGVAAPLGLCGAPDQARRTVSIRDVALHEGWNLVSSYVDPFTRDIEVVQRPIDGQYVVIQSYDQGVLSYDPGAPPGSNTLHSVDAEHGYWIKATAGVSPTLRVVGEVLPEDHALDLDVGWNLVSYLLQQPMTVTTALESIEGQCTAVLGFDGGARSYYPDLDSSFNTLSELKPLYGYWIGVNEPVRLQYRETAQPHRYWLPIVLKNASYARSASLSSRTIPASSSSLAAHGPILVRQGVAVRPPAADPDSTPTAAWVNFYGPAFLTDTVALAVGSQILAIDPDGVVCGAVTVTVDGQYGLLPCYGDDPTTPGVDEGAEEGDPIRFAIDGVEAAQQPLSFNGSPITGTLTATWTAHGDRWEVALSPQPVEFSYWVYLPLVDRSEGAGVSRENFGQSGGPE